MFLDSIDKQPFPLAFAIRNGYAVVLPVLDGTFERNLGRVADWTTVRGRDLAITQAREFRRIIDYIEVRDDLETDRLGYFGRSWGGRVGAIMLAVEPRLSYGILDQAGINAGDHPDINVAHYLPRVAAPVLHFSGLYDTDFRFETSSRPFFERLGTDVADRRHVVEPAGHFVPPGVVIAESLTWLDRYAPVDR
jgi:pimeloyl-ACP methyl ester carboxylesterase